MSGSEWYKIESAFRDLFEREWYTNHGPLVQEFEKKLQDYFSIENAVCINNSGIALTMAIEVLQLDGSVKIYGEESVNILNGLYWSGINRFSGKEKVSSILTSEINGEDIMVVFKEASEKNCSLILDLTQHSTVGYFRKVSAFFADIEKACNIPVLAVLSFDKGCAIEAHGAACIVTNGMVIAERLRNIRSSYGVRQQMSVVKTANGRMSEAQAAFGLVSIKDLTA